MGASKSLSWVFSKDRTPSKMPVIPKRKERCRSTGSGRDDHFMGLRAKRKGKEKRD